MDVNLYCFRFNLLRQFQVESESVQVGYEGQPLEEEVVSLCEPYSEVNINTYICVRVYLCSFSISISEAIIGDFARRQFQLPKVDLLFANVELLKYDPFSTKIPCSVRHRHILASSNLHLKLLLRRTGVYCSSGCFEVLSLQALV